MLFQNRRMALKATKVSHQWLSNMMKLSILLAGIVALAACAGGVGSRAAQEANASLPMPDTTTLVRSNDMRVAPLDVLEVRVFGVEGLNGEYQVDPAGEMKLPLVGVQMAKGLTIFELAAALEKRLSTYVREPQVSIRVKEAYGQQFTVEGAVAKPGVYPIRGDMTLLQALAISGGPTEVADKRRVLVFRTIEKERRVAAFDVGEIRKGQAKDPTIYGNDVIVVDGSQTMTGYRELLRAIPLLGLFIIY